MISTFRNLRGALADSRSSSRVVRCIRFLTEPIRVNLLNLPIAEQRIWRTRIHDVIRCPDRDRIPTHPDAGEVVDGFLVMHNGLRIEPLSYYGYPMLKMFRESRGIHEPQEERIFQEILKHIPSGGTMLELGSYWGFYSMWFQKEVDDASCHLVEPSSDGLDYGRRNFALNGMEGVFTRAFAGAANNDDGEVPTLTVDRYMEKEGIVKLDVLHSDIQGYEKEMLEGAADSFGDGRIGYCLISTHSNDLHDQCEAKLRDFGYSIEASINLDDSFSFDGLLVGRHPSVPSVSHIELSRKSQLDAKRVSGHVG